MSSVAGPGQQETEAETLNIQVQGVGFRPFVSRLAQEHDPVGWVLVHSGGVEVEGPVAVFAISRGVEGSTYIFRIRRPVSCSISLVASTVLAYFEVHIARLFDAPRALC